jgi:hypothetical protein
VLGVVLAQPLLRRLGATGAPAHSSMPLVIAAGAVLVVDVVLKALLAPLWGGWLRAVLP